MWTDIAGIETSTLPADGTELGRAANAISMPLLPVIMTPADIMRAHDAGFTELIFLLASQAGGPQLLEAFGRPFTHIVFCPTAGIRAETAIDYLSLGYVLCVGGSWVVPKAETLSKRDGNDPARNIPRSTQYSNLRVCLAQVSAKQSTHVFQQLHLDCAAIDH